jgi:hypothetical protein
VCKDYSTYKDTIIACESFEDANEVNSVLEKQIPKKVKSQRIDYLVTLYHCPCCDVRFFGFGMKYCGECGQALDWSDTE